MKLSVKLLSGLTLMALIAIVAVSTTKTADAYVDLGSLTPNHPSTIGLYCDDVDNTAWYQVQKMDKETNTVTFIGSTVACSGWEAIRQFALMHDYPSTNAAGNDGVVAGNRGATFIADLPSISFYTP